MLRILRLTLPPLLSIAVACTTATGVLLVGRRAVERADPEPIDVGSSFGIDLAARVARLRGLEPSVAPIAFLGDSTVMAYPPGRTLPAALRHQLDAARERAFVLDFAAPGAGPLEYFVAATLLARTPVKLAIVPVNLAALSEVWQDTWTRAESTGWIPFDRGLAVQRLPLHWFGVTLDRFLFYQAIVASGEAERWNRAQLVQARAGRAITKARARAQGVDHPLATGLPWVPVLLSDERPNRRGALGVEQSYGAALAGVAPDHPALQMLAATVRELGRGGIGTIAYLVPFNVEWARSLGVYDEAGMAVTVRSLRAALEAAGGMVVDLHALLPDAGFRDGANHFAVSATFDGPAQVAAALRPVVSAQLAQRRAPGPRD